VYGFGLGFHVMEVENLHVLEEEFLDVEKEILDVMAVENLHVIEGTLGVRVSVEKAKTSQPDGSTEGDQVG
jgi:hypothetical protein